MIQVEILLTLLSGMNIQLVFNVKVHFFFFFCIIGHKELVSRRSAYKENFVEQGPYFPGVSDGSEVVIGVEKCLLRLA